MYTCELYDCIEQRAEGCYPVGFFSNQKTYNTLRTFYKLAYRKDFNLSQYVVMKTYQMLAAVIVVYLSSFSVTSSIGLAAERLENKHLKQLLLRIYQKTGMSVPEVGDPNFPNVVFVTQQFLNGMVCKNRDCNAEAATKDTTVFLVNGLDVNTIEGESILYHELVHILQFHNFGRNPNCKSWIKRKVQAYQLQDEFVSDKGLDMPWLRSVTHYLTQMCPQ